MKRLSWTDVFVILIVVIVYVTVMALAMHGQTVCVKPPAMPSVYDYDGMMGMQHWMERQLTSLGYEISEPCRYTVFAYYMGPQSVVYSINYSIVGSTPRVGTIIVWPNEFRAPGGWVLTVKETGRFTPLIEQSGGISSKSLRKAMKRAQQKVR